MCQLVDLNVFSYCLFSWLVPYDEITREGTMGRYERMANAITQVAKQTNKAPIVLSLCEWGWVSSWNIWVEYTHLQSRIFSNKSGSGVKNSDNHGVQLVTSNLFGRASRVSSTCA